MLRILTACALFGALPATAFDVTAMTEAERDAFGAEVRAYLLENPEVLTEVIAVLEERRATEAAGRDAELVSRFSEAIRDDGFSWVGGNPEGDITVVEFLDYRCGYCKRAHPAVTELIESDGNIRFVVKEFPILGEASLLGSRFAIATLIEAGDDAYARVHDALMTLEGDLNEAALRRLARDEGLDYDAIAARMDDPEIDRRIRETRRLAQALEINGTPSFVMGDAFVRGFVELDQMRAIVADERDG